jgi:colanic acid/amylovoran biosynthesis glycosyltransferase
MKIAYLINQYPKPSHTFIRREIQALERLGVQVLRISIRGWNDTLVDERDKLERTKTKYVLQRGGGALLLAVLRALIRNPLGLVKATALAVKLAFNHSERPLPVHLIYVAEACQILLWLGAAGIQHVHAHFGTNSADVAMLTHVLGGPTWSVTIHGPAEFDRKPLLNLPEKINRATFVVAISSFGRSQLFRLIAHKYWPKIHIVHCGLEADFYASPPRAVPKTNRIVCVGRLSEPKGQLLLIEAVKRLLDRGTKLELVLAGDGEMRSEIEVLIAQHRLGDAVRLTGWISSDQVRDEILSSKALVLASFAEGLPVVIMEAMALKRPVVATYVAGIPELVKPGEHGWLVPAGDIDALDEALQQLVNTPIDALLGMGQAAHDRIRSRHDIDIEVKKLHRLFCGVVKDQANSADVRAPVNLR